MSAAAQRQRASDQDKQLQHSWIVAIVGAKINRHRGGQGSGERHHPVTGFEVCGSTIANCRMGIGWKNAAFH